MSPFIEAGTIVRVTKRGWTYFEICRSLSSPSFAKTKNPPLFHVVSVQGAPRLPCYACKPVEDRVKADGDDNTLHFLAGEIEPATVGEVLHIQEGAL